MSALPQDSGATVKRRASPTIADAAAETTSDKEVPRTHYIEELQGFFQYRAEGPSVSLVLCGESGIGKSIIAKQFKEKQNPKDFSEQHTYREVLEFSIKDLPERKQKVNAFYERLVFELKKKLEKPLKKYSDSIFLENIYCPKERLKKLAAIFPKVIGKGRLLIVFDDCVESILESERDLLKYFPCSVDILFLTQEKPSTVTHPNKIVIKEASKDEKALFLNQIKGEMIRRGREIVNLRDQEALKSPSAYQFYLQLKLHYSEYTYRDFPTQSFPFAHALLNEIGYQFKDSREFITVLVGIVFLNKRYITRDILNALGVYPALFQQLVNCEILVPEVNGNVYKVHDIIESVISYNINNEERWRAVITNVKCRLSRYFQEMFNQNEWQTYSKEDQEILCHHLETFYKYRDRFSFQKDKKQTISFVETDSFNIKLALAAPMLQLAEVLYEQGEYERSYIHLRTFKDLESRKNMPPNTALQLHTAILKSLLHASNAKSIKATDVFEWFEEKIGSGEKFDNVPLLNFYVYAANTHLRLESYQEAEDVIKKTTEKFFKRMSTFSGIMPELPQKLQGMYWYTRGKIYYQKKNFDDAIKSFHAALHCYELGGRDELMVQHRLVQLYNATGDMEKAKTAFKRCVELEREIGVENLPSYWQLRLRILKARSALWDECNAECNTMEAYNLLNITLPKEYYIAEGWKLPYYRSRVALNLQHYHESSCLLLTSIRQYYNWCKELGLPKQYISISKRFQLLLKKHFPTEPIPEKLPLTDQSEKLLKHLAYSLFKEKASEYAMSAYREASCFHELRLQDEEEKRTGKQSSSFDLSRYHETLKQQFQSDGGLEYYFKKNSMREQMSSQKLITEYCNFLSWRLSKQIDKHPKNLMTVYQLLNNAYKTQHNKSPNSRYTIYLGRCLLKAYVILSEQQNSSKIESIVEPSVSPEQLLDVINTIPDNIYKASTYYWAARLYAQKNKNKAAQACYTNAFLCYKKLGDSSDVYHKRMTECFLWLNNNKIPGPYPEGLQEVQAYAEKNPRRIYGRTRLHKLILDGNVDALRKHLEPLQHTPSFKTYLNRADLHGLTGLHFAVLTRKIECVRFLLSCGANPNLVDDDGYTPLGFATYFSFTDAALILAEKTNVTLQTHKHTIALQSAFEFGQKVVTDALRIYDVCAKTNQHAIILQLLGCIPIAAQKSEPEQKLISLLRAWYKQPKAASSEIPEEIRDRLADCIRNHTGQCKVMNTLLFYLSVHFEHLEGIKHLLTMKQHSPLVHHMEVVPPNNTVPYHKINTGVTPLDYLFAKDMPKTIQTLSKAIKDFELKEDSIPALEYLLNSIGHLEQPYIVSEQSEQIRTVWYVLCASIRGGNHALVEKIIGKYSQFLLLRDYKNYDALYHAIISQNLKMVMKIMSLAETHRYSERIRKSTHYLNLAAHIGNQPIFSYLLKICFKTNIKEVEWCPLHEAMLTENANRFDIIDSIPRDKLKIQIKKKLYGFNVLQLAAIRRDITLVHFLISKIKKITDAPTLQKLLTEKDENGLSANDYLNRLKLRTECSQYKSSRLITSPSLIFDKKQKTILGPTFRICYRDSQESTIEYQGDDGWVEKEKIPISKDHPLNSKRLSEIRCADLRKIGKDQYELLLLDYFGHIHFVPLNFKDSEEKSSAKPFSCPEFKYLKWIRFLPGNPKRLCGLNQANQFIVIDRDSRKELAYSVETGNSCPQMRINRQDNWHLFVDSKSEPKQYALIGLDVLQNRLKHYPFSFDENDKIRVEPARAIADDHCGKLVSVTLCPKLNQLGLLDAQGNYHYYSLRGMKKGFDYFWCDWANKSKILTSYLTQNKVRKHPAKDLSLTTNTVCMQENNYDTGSGYIILYHDQCDADVQSSITHILSKLKDRKSLPDIYQNLDDVELAIYNHVTGGKQCPDLPSTLTKASMQPKKIFIVKTGYTREILEKLKYPISGVSVLYDYYYLSRASHDSDYVLVGYRNPSFRSIGEILDGFIPQAAKVVSDSINRTAKEMFDLMQQFGPYVLEDLVKSWDKDDIATLVDVKAITPCSIGEIKGYRINPVTVTMSLWDGWTASASNCEEKYSIYLRNLSRNMYDISRMQCRLLVVMLQKKLANEQNDKPMIRWEDKNYPLVLLEYYLLAQLFFRLERFDALLALSANFHKVHNVDSKNKWILEIRALCDHVQKYRVMKIPENAVVATVPKSCQAKCILLMATTQLYQGKYDEAQQMLRRLKTAPSKYITAKKEQLMGMILLHKGQIEPHLEEHALHYFDRAERILGHQNPHLLCNIRSRKAYVYLAMSQKKYTGKQCEYLKKAEVLHSQNEALLAATRPDASIDTVYALFGHATFLFLTADKQHSAPKVLIRLEQARMKLREARLCLEKLTSQNQQNGGEEQLLLSREHALIQALELACIIAIRLSCLNDNLDQSCEQTEILEHLTEEKHWSVLSDKGYSQHGALDIPTTPEPNLLEHSIKMLWDTALPMRANHFSSEQKKSIEKVLTDEKLNKPVNRLYLHYYLCCASLPGGFPLRGLWQEKSASLLAQFNRLKLPVDLDLFHKLSRELQSEHTSKMKSYQHGVGACCTKRAESQAHLAPFFNQPSGNCPQFGVDQPRSLHTRW